MTTYHTGNPIGSTDPRDLYDNSQNLDHFANSDALTYEDRFGRERKTAKGVEQSAPIAVSAANRAESAADRAEGAADTASLAAGVYPSTNAIVNGGAGFQPVPDGHYATVPSQYEDGFLDLYQRTGSAVLYIDTYPNKAAVQAALVSVMQRVGYARYPLSVFGERARDIEVDASGKVAGGGDVLADIELRVSALENGEGASVVRGHIAVGQSNARGAGDPVPFPLTATAVYVRQAFMPGGPGMNVAVGTGAGGNYDPINPANFDSFVPLHSMQLSASNSTTLLEGIGWSQAQLEESQGVKCERLYWTTAQGGVSLSARSPGTVPYSNMLAALERSVQISIERGSSYVVDALHSVEGEADTATTNFDQQLISVYAEQLTADIKQATAQTFDPPVILSQPSSFFGGVEGVLGIYRAARDNSRMHLATAGYHLPYWTDLLHYTGLGHVMNGEYHLRVLRALRAGRIWRPVMPKFIKWDGGTGLDVWFHVPEPPLVLDLTAPHHGDFGFVIRADGVNQTISSIEQIGPDHIHFEVASPLGSNRSLQYAMRGYQSSPRQPGDGPMGALHDSCDAPSMFDPSHTLWNWGVHFLENF
ncbi:hypothetical protein [Alcaligenes sp. WGS1538]|uniref:hypothetical protein n=1 Tax=Alcaligenes sp. WGS1538 TaxID=3366811 RepID=UPI00372D34EB